MTDYKKRTPPPASEGNARDYSHKKHITYSKSVLQMRADLLSYFIDSSRHGLTVNEGQSKLRTTAADCFEHIKSLQNLGIVRDSGRRRIGPNHNMVIVWVVGMKIGGLASAQIKGQFDG